MKFTCTVEIDLPVKKVAELFVDNEYRKKWQKEFIGSTPISGTPGQPGSKSKVMFRFKGRDMELTETITVRNLPHEFSGLYEHVHMVNTMRNLFTPLGENKTRYDAEIEYTKFNGIIPNLMALIMPGVFKNQVQKTLEQFEEFVEKDNRPI